MMIINRKTYIYWIGFLVSLGLTVFTIHLYPIFNPDGLLYLKGAEAYLSQGFHASNAIYHWPLYQILIAWTHHLTTLSLLNAAYLLNAICTAFTVVVFLMLIKAIGGSRRILWLSLFVILAFHPFNSYRADLIRGHGYWLFYLLSLFYLIRFSQTFSWFFAFGWFISIIVATLFRIEGTLFLMFAPFAVWWFRSVPWSKRLTLYLKLNTLSIVGIIVSLIFIAIHPVSLNTLGRIPELLGEFKIGILGAGHTFELHTLALKTYVLTTLGASDATKFMLSGVFSVYVFSIVSVISLAYTVLLIYAWIKRAFPAPFFSKVVIWGYMLINVVITLVFYLQHLFLSGRYLFPLALTFLCYVPFGFRALFYQWQNRQKSISIHSWLFPLVFLLILSMIIGSLHCFGPSKVYINNAAKWIKRNTQPSATIYTNYHRFGYFSERKTGGWAIQSPLYFEKYKQTNTLNKQPWKNFDYLVLTLNKHELAIEKRIEKITGLKPIQVYHNNHGSRLFIFKLGQDH